MKTIFIRLLAVALSLSALPSNAAPIDLSSFSVIQFSGSQPENANWVLGAGNTRISQVNNNNYSLYISDFDASNSRFEWNGGAISGDDDAIGFVWGFQDTDNYFQFFWTGQNNATAASIIKVENGVWTTLSSGPPQWGLNVNYSFLLDFLPTQSIIEIATAGNPIVDMQITDSSWTVGKFGFLTLSQAGTFNSLEITPLAPPGVPVPGSIQLMLLGLVALGFRKHIRT